MRTKIIYSILGILLFHSCDKKKVGCKSASDPYINIISPISSWKANYVDVDFIISPTYKDSYTYYLKYKWYLLKKDDGSELYSSSGSISTASELEVTQGFTASSLGLTDTTDLILKITSNTGDCDPFPEKNIEFTINVP